MISYLIEESSTPVGYVQSWQVDEPACGIDIFLDPTKQGQGLGTDAVRALVGHLTAIEGSRMVTADPAPDNVRALVGRCSVKLSRDVSHYFDWQ